MEEVIRELVRSVILYRTDGEPKLGIIDAESKNIIGEDPLFLLDGVPLTGHAEVLEIDPTLLRFIHVVDSRYFVGEMEFDGIIDLRSVRGDFSDFDLPSSAVRFKFQGTAGNPATGVGVRHTNPSTVSKDQRPDYRTLLFWDPDIQTEEDGAAGFSFLTPDVPGIYKVVIEGKSRNGAGGRAQSLIRVE